MELYANDNEGRYPPAFGALVPNYLKTFPTCPAAGFASYVNNYAVTRNPDAYTVMCSGNTTLHGECGLAQNFPQMTSAGGLVTH